MNNQVINKRKSFIIHKDSLHILKDMTNEQAGIFIKAIDFYQQNGHLPDLDFGLKMAIAPFINQFERDEENYKKTCEARREAGSIGGKQKVANASKSKQKVANLADNKNKNKNKNDNESKNKNDSIIETIDIYQELTEGLRFILEAKLNRTIKTKGWKEEIRKLIEIDLKPRGKALEDVKRAIQAIADHSGKPYFPVIQAAASLREKFGKIENFLNNLKPSQTNNMNDIFNNLMQKYDNE